MFEFSFYSISGIWLGKTSPNNIHFAKFTKDFPMYVYLYTYIPANIKMLKFENIYCVTRDSSVPKRQNKFHHKSFLHQNI